LCIRVGEIKPGSKTANKRAKDSEPALQTMPHNSERRLKNSHIVEQYELSPVHSNPSITEQEMLDELAQVAKTKVAVLIER